MTVYLVLIDNGDTEPEVWAFKELEDADAFIAARGAGTMMGVALMHHGEARQAIASELSGV